MNAVKKPSFINRFKAAAKFVFSPGPSASYGSGGYGGGYYRGSSNSSGAKYAGGIPNSGRSTTINHRQMRGNARNTIMDSPIAKAMVERRAETAADVGLRPECMPIANILGIKMEEAEKWGEDVEQRYSLWAKSKKQNRSEKMTFNATQTLYQKNDEGDGENFVRLYYSKDKKLLNPLQFEMLDPNQIRGSSFTNNQIPSLPGHDGITRDERGREKNYKVWKIGLDGRYKEETIPRVGEKSGRTFMLHGFVPDLPGQQRGYSKIGHIIQEFTQVTNLNLSVINKALHQSQFVFFTKNNTQDPSNLMDDMPKMPSTGIGSHTTVSGDGAGDICEEPTAAEVEWCGLDNVPFTEPGATIVGNLKQGDDIEAMPQNSPAIGYAEFIKTFVSFLSASRGMPYEALLMQFSNNYSASRAALVLFWRVVNIRREEMVRDYLNPVFEIWLSEEIAASRIKAPGWSDPILRAAWLNCEWYGSPMPNIDPGREANASKVNLELNATTIDRVSRNLNGSSGAANIAKNNRTFEEMAIPPWSKANTANNNGGGGNV